MLKKSIFLFGLFFLLCQGFAQVSVDVFDPFYEDLINWENKGLITDTPLMWPLPLQEVERILDLVKEIGDERDRRLATEHYERFFGRFIRGGAKLDFGFGYVQGNNFYINATPVVDLNYKLAKYLSVGLQFLLDLTNKTPNEEPLPQFLTSNRDISNDDVRVGSFKVLPSFNSGVTVGTAEYYFSAQISRTSYGHFRDLGIFVSRSVPKQGVFSLVINKPLFSVNSSLLMLATTDDFGKNIGPNKYLSIHSFYLRPLDWISFGVIDSVIFGGRFEPIYLIPFSFYFVSQGMFGFPDNSVLGFDFSIKPIDGLNISGAIYMDDMGFNEIVQFKSAKARMSGEFGISYTMPKKSWFRSVSFDYTFVTPYTYTHLTNEHTSNLNYQSYTHSGKNVGTNLEPNSDRFYLKAEFEPIDPIRISLTNTLVRHGNINESITDPLFLFKYMTEKYNTDGSVLNHAGIWVGNIRKDTLLYSNPFLKQSIINYVYQLSLDFSCHLPIRRSGGHIQAYLGYCFEADINSGVSHAMFYKSTISEQWSGAKWEEVVSGTFNVNGNTFTTADIIAERDRQVQEWKTKATGKKFNHYVKLGLSFTY